MTDEERRIKYLNDSGFLLQLCVEEEIRRTSDSHRWDILGREIPWHDPDTGMDGFADLLIENGRLRILIECKRVKNADWIFLLPPSMRTPSAATSTFWIDQKKDAQSLSSWNGVACNPAGDVSEFCVVPGQDKRSSLLEREASILIAASRGVGLQELELMESAGRRRDTKLYFPMLITTARLFVAEFDPQDATLDDGTINADDVEMREVSYVRFQKSFNTGEGLSPHFAGFGLSLKSNNRSLFVINAEKISSFLSRLHVSLPQNPDERPWNRARSVEELP